jgi:hypothetical protein
MRLDKQGLSDCILARFVLIVGVKKPLLMFVISRLLWLIRMRKERNERTLLNGEQCPLVIKFCHKEINTNNKSETPMTTRPHFFFPL